MSPRESPVKISNLAYKPQKMVNAGRNEPGSHDILSLPRLAGLNIK